MSDSKIPKLAKNGEFDILNGRIRHRHLLPYIRHFRHGPLQTNDTLTSLKILPNRKLAAKNDYVKLNIHQM